MIDVAIYGYTASAIAFLVLSVLLASAWRGRQEGGLLLLASSLSILWSVVAVFQATEGFVSSVYLFAAEVLRDIAWLIFLMVIVAKARQKSFPKPILWIIALSAVIISVVLGIATFINEAQSQGDGFRLQVFVFLALALCGLILVEQIFRNTSIEARWAVKYLCLGLGGVFAFDFYMYADALLLNTLDQDIWGARGYINTLIMPLIAVSAARNPQWSLDVFVSRHFVFYSSTLIASGLYLMAMAAGGYYIRHVGGDWGELGQLVFFFGAILILLVVIFSGQMRARLRVFLNKHFFNYRYDYREEWLRVIQSLSEAQLDSNLKTTVISVMAKIVESPGGMLWLKQDDAVYQIEASWNMPDNVSCRQDENAELVDFLARRKWVVDVDQLNDDPAAYQHLNLPRWMCNIPDVWLVVPLIIGAEVALSSSGGGAPSSAILGFVVLRRPRAKMLVNWEVRDLLLMTGRQCAGYLALLKANEDLVDARQFEAFNRLSAYVVHDLKNLIAQLSLIVSNAERHKDNPVFINDAFTTVENTVSKMNYMLRQLRKGKSHGEDKNNIELNEVLAGVVKRHSKGEPAPEFISTDADLRIIANESRFSAVIGHLIQNAQEATDASGFVRVSIRREDNHALVLIQDNGCGMSKDFIRTRLFRPFDTTKGNAGMGIGVYESREFIRDIGGQLDVHSEPGKGTTFFIRLKTHSDNDGQQRAMGASI
ncbi:MAG TPA: PEP-CTERM system histidine kinase PrsK [Gammaproteobacteria bacterium]|nr:PEP-CTERM system histidine kinase PrsK [Gammaproteobacteria bacterium]